MHTAFAALIELALSQPNSLLSFTLLILPILPGERTSGCVVLSYVLG